MRLFKHLARFVKYSSVFVLIYMLSYLNRLFADVGMLVNPESMQRHQEVVNTYFGARKAFITSNLGAYMFKYHNTRKLPSYVVSYTPERGYFDILIWRHWPWLKRRHESGFGTQIANPLHGCSVSNCRFKENNDTFLSTADLVVVHLQKGGLPDVSDRTPSQLWAFWSDESPRNTFSLATEENTLSFHQMANIFNWSMTYRSDSDIPVPYGRTVPLPYPKLNEVTDDELKQLVPYWDKKQNDILVANIMSRCVTFRMRLIAQLRRYLSVDMFGKCAEVKNNTNRCPGHFMRDCPVISEYYFYIVIENSNCRQYISEKIFHHAYSKGAIPIIAGAPLVDCTKLLPPNSFLHLDNFLSLKHLAREIYAISADTSRLLSYHAWRNNFKVVEEHGFLGTRSLVMCRICEALNYNDRSPKVYKTDDIRLYLDPLVCCVPDRKW